MNSPISLESADSNSPLVVALVEDDRLLREEIEVHLTAHGFQVHAANSAMGLDDLTARVAFDLYLIDLNLPGDLGRRLKQAQTTTAWSLSLRDRTLVEPNHSQKLRLTSKEKTILLALVQAKDNTLESGVLCDLFTEENEDSSMSKHALEEMIARLRKKFKSVQAEGDEPAIKSVWGVGYQLCVRINFVH